MVAVVLCCGRDESLLPEFLAAWQRSGVETVLLEDREDPVEDRRGMESVPFSWQSKNHRVQSVSIVDSLLTVAEKTGAKTVLKLDVDTIHFSFDWFKEPGWDAIGYQYAVPRLPKNFYGLAYAVTRETLEAVKQDYEQFPPVISGEDICFSQRLQMMRKKVLLKPWETITSAKPDVFTDPERYAEKEMVHCGSFGKMNRAGRTLDAMKALNQFCRVASA